MIPESANKDGNGFSISCQAMPLTGRIVMRKITDKATGAKRKAA